MTDATSVRKPLSDEQDFNRISHLIGLLVPLYETAVKSHNVGPVIGHDDLGGRIAELLRLIEGSLPGARRYLAQHGKTFVKCGERYVDTAVQAPSAHHAVLAYVEEIRSRLTSLLVRIIDQKYGKLTAVQTYADFLKLSEEEQAERLAVLVPIFWTLMVHAIHPADVQSVTQWGQLMVALKREYLLAADEITPPQNNGAGKEEEKEREAPPASQDKDPNTSPLSSGALRLLNRLAELDSYERLLDLSISLGVTEKTLGKYLSELVERSLACRPDSGRGGAAITELGRQFLSQTAHNR